MAYDESLAERIRSVVAGRPDVTERKMFGGLAFMSGGNMFCGIVRDELMVRVGAQNYESLLARPGARPMDFNGRPMTGMLYIGRPTIDEDANLSEWVEQCYEFASSLPAKKATSGPRRKAK
jgi:TfoX/Sxy family transcriptional regulator of competence genes